MLVQFIVLFSRVAAVVFLYFILFGFKYLAPLLRLSCCKSFISIMKFYCNRSKKKKCSYLHPPTQNGKGRQSCIILQERSNPCSTGLPKTKVKQTWELTSERRHLMLLSPMTFRSLQLMPNDQS